MNNEQLPRIREASVVGNWRRASNFCNPVRLPPCSSGSPPPRVVKNYEYCNIDKWVPPTPKIVYKGNIKSPLPSAWWSPPHPPRRPTARQQQVSSQSVPRSRAHYSPCRSPEQPSGSLFMMMTMVVMVMTVVLASSHLIAESLLSFRELFLRLLRFPVAVRHKGGEMVAGVHLVQC